ncbi:metallophosphoesterase family protein [Robertkochia solimangrovi]|uniref:metallophosphoesterase family protein n=1 Tax=Robertkochia solimangrovi TaxID=2213046 RepID=UPI0011814236|nr:metallophosphoesterase family protein [Robertkochia solimangrovi]TRZ45885.1 serine/threonine protein phosphatase [Robertkochia solimangrovi]
MTQRTYVIGDIHGALKALDQVLDKAPLQKGDKLIFLGDYVDGWSESPGVIDRLIEIRDNYECIFIRGNHDDLFLKFLLTGKKNDQWLIHGGNATLESYQDIPNCKLEIHRTFLESLENYHLDEQNRLFLHAGFTSLHGIEREYFEEMFYWDRSLWEMVKALNPNLDITDPLYPDRLKHYHEIFIGHTPTTRIGYDVPLNFASVWNLDTGAAYMSPLTIMDVETKEYWQSDRVNKLYPDEPGRNR